MAVRLKHFWYDEDGAVTVDWVALTAGIVVLALLVGLQIWRPTVDAADRVMAYAEDNSGL